MRTLVLAALLALAACHPSAPVPGEADAGVLDAPPLPDPEPDAAPIEPPGTAMETVSAAGTLHSGLDTLDVQLGGVSRATSASGTTTFDTAPVLH